MCFTCHVYLFIQKKIESDEEINHFLLLISISARRFQLVQMGIPAGIRRFFKKKESNEFSVTYYATNKLEEIFNSIDFQLINSFSYSYIKFLCSSRDATVIIFFEN